jgi:hypothetical protein
MHRTQSNNLQLFSFQDFSPSVNNFAGIYYDIDWNRLRVSSDRVGCDAALQGKWIPKTQPHIPEDRNHPLCHSKNPETLKSCQCHRH